MADEDALHGAEIESQRDHHWRVSFEAYSEELGEWVFDELVVAAGPDSWHALERLREHVLNPQEYGGVVTQMRTLDIRLLSEADI